MRMAQKVKSKKVRMSPRTKEVLVLTFKSLFSNQAVVDASKSAPWWLAVIFFIIGIMLPLIPVMTYYSGIYGGSFLDSTRYGLNEISLSSSLTSLDDLNYEFKFDGNHDLLLYNNDVHESRPVPSDIDDPYDPAFDTYPIYRFITEDTKEGEPWHQFSLDIYFSDRTYEADAAGNNINSLITLINNRKYKGGTTDLLPPNATLEDGEYLYAPSYLIFHKKGVFAQINKTNTATIAKGSYVNNSNWDNTTIDSSLNGLIDRILTVKNSEGTEVARDLANRTYTEGVYKNLKEIFNETYLAYKPGAFWINTSIYFSIFVGLVGFMGFLLWLLTRGRNNMFNYLSIWATMKMSFWSCFTPGLIAMIAGFIFSNQSLMVFIMTVGIRVMWMSMKQLRPQ